ncbi:MAG: ABC transporter ATP-binding protein, partial [Desulfovibrio sp.]
KPSILLLDEPCTGLDAQSRAEFFVFLENLSRTMQIIMVSHYDEDCPEFINREAAMRDGRLATIR